MLDEHPELLNQGLIHFFFLIEVLKNLLTLIPLSLFFMLFLINFVLSFEAHFL